MRMNEEDLLNKNAILINNVDEGFKNYEYLILEGDKAGYKEFMSEILSLNGEQGVYADFYYEKLSAEQKDSFLKALSKEKLEFFNHSNWAGGIYFSLNEEILDFLLDITMDELLFSSFYFTKYPCTVWGNYGLKFPAFFKDKEIKNRYQELALSCGLKKE